MIMNINNSVKIKYNKYNFNLFKLNSDHCRVWFLLTCPSVCGIFVHNQLLLVSFQVKRDPHVKTIHTNICSRKSRQNQRLPYFSHLIRY
jgi:hypothetical protein